MTNTTEDTKVKTFSADPDHSQVTFSARHLGFSKVRGNFEKFDAVVRLDPEDLTTLEAEATIESASINTRVEDRDNHLRSGDFLLADEYPHIIFKSTGVKDVSGNNITLTGDLTIRDVTKTVELQGEYLGEGTDPWGGARVGFEAKTKINRYDFGLKWNQMLEAGGLLVSEEVEIILEIQAVEQ